MTRGLQKLEEQLRKQNISSRTFLITGGNSGFGYLVARTLLRAGGRVILGCRSEERARDACERLKEESGSQHISYLLVDMENPKSISDCVEAIKRQQLHINVLVNNAGVSMVHTYTESPTGVEKTCQTNYLGLVQFTELMTPLLEREADPRVINVSSLTYVKGRPAVIDAQHLPLQQSEYERFNAYYRSKYLVTSYTQYYARQHPRVFAVACDPGVAATNIARELGVIGWLYSRRFFQLFAPTWKVAV